MKAYKCVGHSGYVPLHPLSSLWFQERRGRERENRGIEEKRETGRERDGKKEEGII